MNNLAVLKEVPQVSAVVADNHIHTFLTNKGIKSNTETLSVWQVKQLLLAYKIQLANEQQAQHKGFIY